MKAGERQVAPDISGIRRDHVARYEWAAKELGCLPVSDISTVLDLGCGVGYGSKMLINAVDFVRAVDVEPEAIDYANTHYKHHRIAYQCGDVESVLRENMESQYDAAICFEMVEHFSDPLPMLKLVRQRAKRLYVSVPNEEVFPYLNYKFHFRHYTPAQFRELLLEAGWQPISWFGQADAESEVEAGCMGRTIIAVCQPRTELASVPALVTTNVASTPFTVVAPEHVVILGLGPSLHTYLDQAKGVGARGKVADEVWAINALGDVLQCDRVFHMDDVRIQEIRAAALPDSNIAHMLTWLKKHPGPIYTSRAHPDYPGLVEFPLEDVVAATGQGYFNNTAAYAVAYAIYIGVKKISLYGCDYTYPNAHEAEKGRACLEFWLGYAAAKGIKLSMPKHTTLMDALVTDNKRYYGYNAVEIHRTRDATGRIRFEFKDRPVLPTAAQIEADYDHSVHPNLLVK